MYVIRTHLAGQLIYLKRFPKRNHEDFGAYASELERAITFEKWHEAQQALNLLSVKAGYELPQIVNFKTAEIEYIVES